MSRPTIDPCVELVEIGRSLFQRGLATGSSGNLSVRSSDGTMFLTPTGVSLGTLCVDDISHVAADGRLLSGKPATKELFLHQAMYLARPAASAIVHLHATHSAAVSCLEIEDESDCLPPLTAYHVMKIGRLPLVPYFRPGDPGLAEAIGQIASEHPAILLANHGPIVTGGSLSEAMYRVEELEETAKLFLLTRGMRTRPLDCEQTAELERVFGPSNNN